MKWNEIRALTEFFLVNLAVGWLNNHCKLILVIELKFG